VDLGALPKEFQEPLEHIMMQIQPAHLQLQSRNSLQPAERDIVRSTYIREKLQEMPPPQL
jgi:protein-arginine kinase